MDFSHFMCGGQALGPWDGSSFTFCFVDSVLYIVLAAALVVFAPLRLYQVYYSESKAAPTIPGLKFRLATCTLLVALSLSTLIGLYAQVALQPYEIVRLVVLAGSWFVVAAVFVAEDSRNLSSNYCMQLWCVLAFTMDAIRLQSVLALWVSFDWTVVLFLADMLLSLILSIAVWLFNGAEDQLKVAAEKKASTVAGATLQVQDESFPLLAPEKREGKLFVKSPEETANIFSKLLFLWANSLYATGLTRALEQDDLWPLVEDDKSENVSREFMKHWEAEQARPKDQRSLKRAVWRTFGTEFVIGGLYKLINDTMVFAGPLLLNLIIQFISTPSWPIYYGVCFSLGLLLSSMIMTFAVNTYFFNVFRVGQRARSAMVGVVYEKAFCISNSGRQDYTTGEITNLMSVDATRLQNLTPYLNMVWSAPLQIIVSIVLLYRQVGPSVFAGLGFMLLLIPLNAILIKRLSNYQKLMMANKDKRQKMMSEILSGIRIIKFFVWENSYEAATNQIRQVEVDTLKKSAYLRATTLFSWMITPVFVALFTFLTFTLSGNELTASIAFTSVALFNVLRFPLNMLPNVISNLVDAHISMQRIQKFLLSDDRDPGMIEWNRASNSREGNALQMENASFRWSEAKETLHNLTFAVPKGKLVAVVGGVGCGKSSLLSAFLGDLERTSGRAIINGSLAYASQQAWIQNASLRDNVLFGLPYDEARYQSVIDACQLQPDLNILPAGDETEIGEKGINLSGGQKQRVSLARAVYANKDIYLLDDVLSAVDVHVGRAIFEQTLKGVLKGKTVLVVTHQLQYLPNVDHILCLKNGSLVEEGSYESLMKARGDFSRIIREFSVGGDMEAVMDFDNTAAARAPAKKEESFVKKAPADGSKGGIMSIEEREVGRLSSHVFLDYIVACGGVALLIVILLVETGSKTGTDFWLSAWSNDPGLLDHPLAFWLGIYSSLGVAAGIATWLRALLASRGGVDASYNLHKSLLHRILRAPTSFFDSTPVGRILNRFSSDIYVIDEQLPYTLGMLASMTLACTATIIVISTVTPLFLVFLFPLAYVYRYAQQYYIASSRELKRLDSISRSPVYNHFTETIDGVSTIRSYGMEGVFVQTNRDRLDTNQTAYFCFTTANRWLAVRLETVGNVVVTLAALFAVFSRGSVSPGLAGLSISYALSLTGTLNWLVRQSTDAETQMVSVERVIQYSNVPQEPPAEIPSRDPPNSWPQNGAVSFKGYSLRYREGLDLVLKNITINILPRQKIGLVGRTGAGKSSLVLALFRFVEAASGSITIDNVDIGQIGTARLRQALTIIPQDPVLFTGTVRRNLDPFEEHTDEEVWTALQRVYLRDEVTRKGGLESAVAEGGENFSVGQRQLFCMARALLRPAKLLLLDESTANCDSETDFLIQKTIREAFADKTVITIAHRINTVMDSDKILVLQKGEVAEFDSPQRLLDNPKSIFYSMVNETRVGDD